jgi:hypothetical protein
MRVLIGIVAIAFAGTLIGCASPKPTQALVVGPTSPMSEDEKAKALIAKSIETGKPVMTTEGNLLVCKTESVTNTRLKDRKVCMTKEQWAARTDSARDAFQDTKRGSEELPPRGN